MNFGREKKFNHLSFESTNTPSLPRRRPRRVLPIEIVQVARGEEARRGREAVDAAPTAGGQREARFSSFCRSLSDSLIGKAPCRDF